MGRAQSGEAGRMKAHQRIIREKFAAAGDDHHLLGLNTSPQNARFCEISHKEARVIIKKYEWLGSYCNAPIAAFGIFWSGECGGVVVYGAPSPPIVARSALGKDAAKEVCQLARGACVHWAHPHAASMLIAYSTRQMGAKGMRLAVAYCDPDAGEIGTVYQAANWSYCGLSAKRPDYFDANGKRMVGHFQVAGLTRGVRTRKYKYVTFLGPKSRQRQTRKLLRWQIESDYPKRGPSNGRANSNS